MQTSPSEDNLSENEDTINQWGSSTPDMTACLFSPAQVAIAAFLGSIPAGCLLLWLNFKVLKQDKLANQTVLWGSLAFVALVVLGLIIPMPAFVGVVIGGSVALAFAYIARSTYGDAYAHHVQTKGKIGSWWATIGAGLGMFLLTLMIAIAINLLVILAFHK